MPPSLLAQCPREEDTEPKPFLKNASGLLQAAPDDGAPGPQGTRAKGWSRLQKLVRGQSGHLPPDAKENGARGAAWLPRRAGFERVVLGRASERAPQLMPSVGAPGADTNGPLPPAPPKAPPAGPPPHVPVASEDSG